MGFGLAAVHSADDGLLDLSATAAIAAMRSGQLRAEGYARALLDRAAVLGVVNAFISLDPDQVLAAARECDRVRRSGRPCGVMHGLPIPAKDSLDTATLPTSNGTRALRGFRPKRDAAVLAPLLAAGAFVMGKTNMEELSAGWWSNNHEFGAVRNPYDLQHSPGGSSGGSAAVVAARIAPMAVGETPSDRSVCRPACAGSPGCVRPSAAIRERACWASRSTSWINPHPWHGR